MLNTCDACPGTHALIYVCRVEAGLEARKGAEERSERVVAEWQATLKAGEVDEEIRKQELKAVEKLEVLLKVSSARERKMIPLNSSKRKNTAVARGWFCFRPEIVFFVSRDGVWHGHLMQRLLSFVLPILSDARWPGSSIAARSLCCTLVRRLIHQTPPSSAVSPSSCTNETNTPPLPLLLPVPSPPPADAAVVGGVRAVAQFANLYVYRCSSCCLPSLYPAPAFSQVYLQDEERKERRERVQLAEQGRCDTASRREGGDGQGGAGWRAMAAALGPCEDNTVEREAAAKVGRHRCVSCACCDAHDTPPWSLTFYACRILFDWKARLPFLLQFLD